MRIEFDPEVHDQLKKIGGDALLQQLFDLYLTHTPERISRIRRGLEEGDLVLAGKAIHSLRSSSATLGATGLAERLGELEAMATREEAEALGAAWAELGPTVDSFVEEIRQRRAT